MAVECSECKGELSNFKEIIKCTVENCGKNYHIECRKITADNFRKMGKKKLTWKCAMCDPKTQLNELSNAADGSHCYNEGKGTDYSAIHDEENCVTGKPPLQDGKPRATLERGEPDNTHNQRQESVYGPSLVDESSNEREKLTGPPGLEEPYNHYNAEVNCSRCGQATCFMVESKENCKHTQLSLRPKDAVVLCVKCANQEMTFSQVPTGRAFTTELTAFQNEIFARMAALEATFCGKLNEMMNSMTRRSPGCPTPVEDGRRRNDVTPAPPQGNTGPTEHQPGGEMRPSYSQIVKNSQHTSPPTSQKISTNKLNESVNVQQNGNCNLPNEPNGEKHYNNEDSQKEVQDSNKVVKQNRDSIKRSVERKDDKQNSNEVCPPVRKLNRQPVIGTSGRGNLKVVPPRFTRVKRIFVSRLAPSTSEQNIKEFLSNELKIDVNCIKLKTKHESYASFCIEANEEHYEALVSPDLWDAGVLLFPFFGRPTPANKHKPQLNADENNSGRGPPTHGQIRR